MKRFEDAVRRCPEVRECYLMTGIADYLLRVEARDAADYERIHKEALSRMPGVARIQSSFAIRNVVGGWGRPMAGAPQGERAPRGSIPRRRRPVRQAAAGSFAAGWGRSINPRPVRRAQQNFMSPGAEEIHAEAE